MHPCERELPFGWAGCQSLLKGKLQLTDLLYKQTASTLFLWTSDTFCWHPWPWIPTVKIFLEQLSRVDIESNLKNLEPTTLFWSPSPNCPIPAANEYVNRNANSVMQKSALLNCNNHHNVLLGQNHPLDLPGARLSKQPQCQVWKHLLDQRPNQSWLAYAPDAQHSSATVWKAILLSVFCSKVVQLHSNTVSQQ